MSEPTWARVRRWRERHPDEVRQSKRDYYARRRKPCQRAYEPWTERDLKMVMEQSLPDKELALKLGRSVLAIQVMRCRQRAATGLSSGQSELAIPA